MKRIVSIVQILILMFSVTACASVDNGVEIDEGNVGVEEHVQEEPEAIAAEEPLPAMPEPITDEYGFVWRVAPNLEYDENKNLYGRYGSDEGGDFFDMWPENDFLLMHNWFPDVLKTYQKIDSDKVKVEIFEYEYGGDSWEKYDLSDAIVVEKHAIVLGAT